MTQRIPDFGAVKVIAGKHKGRIASLEDLESRSGVCYFGSIVFHETYDLIQLRYLQSVTTDDLWKRKNEIMDLINPFNQLDLDPEVKVDLLFEYHFIYNVLEARWQTAREEVATGKGKRVFISHSSKDDDFSRWLAVDLGNLGHRPWLDEWEIRVGHSIPKRISEGLGSCDVLIVVLSPNSVSSGWVEREWHSKYWDEVGGDRVIVIPVLIESCEIPILLKHKRYADFRVSHQEGLKELLGAI